MGIINRLIQVIILLASVHFCNTVHAQKNIMIGAQVFIEPGQTEAETELWFKTMKENGMGICRIRMFESYMRKPDGTWDFSLFDRAFRYAEKYNIKIMGTFFPATEKTDIGGWKFPEDKQQLDSFAEYIKKCVIHFKKYKSLFAWVLINEPGGGLRNSPFSHEMRAKWEEENPVPTYLPNGYPFLVDLQDDRFMNYMTSWMLNWIAGEVSKHDPSVHLHVNNHAIFSNLPEYDFPYWRTFLNSLGGSAHASWHFGMFTRQQYALAMSANSEILMSGAGTLPWLMTELQGGNNTYSAYNPMCPTREEITQWLWTIIGIEGKGGIFWSLNPRASGVEAGEWALLDFQHQPTERVEAIKSVTECISANRNLFENVKKTDPGITLLYFRESFWAESAISKGRAAESDDRISVMRNMMGHFKAFSELGVSPNIKAFEEFEFEKDDFSGQSIVLAHQIAIPAKAIALLESFVSKGGKLFVDGLTGYFDENVHNWMLTGFPLVNLFGGKISEFRYLPGTEKITLENSEIPISHWKGFIRPDKKSTIIAGEEDKIFAVRSIYGQGNIVWIPSLLGLPAWENAQPLATFLNSEFNIQQQQVSFDGWHENVLMKSLGNGNSTIIILINKSKNSETIKINLQDKRKKPKVLFSDGEVSISGESIRIEPEKTVVVKWQ
jgi:beta-galactosidase